MGQHKYIKIVFAALLIGAVSLAIYIGVTTKSEKSGNVKNSYTINITSAYANAKVLVAQEKGFFAKQGLIVEVNIFSLGKDALLNMLKNDEIKLALAYETPIVKEIINGENIQVITTMHQSTESTKLIVKTNSEKIDGETLRGKKFAVTMNTSMEFAFIHYINSLGLNTSDLSIIDVRPEKLAAAALDPSFTGVMAWDDYLDSIQGALKQENIAYKTPPLGYTEFSYLLSRSSNSAVDIENQRRFLLAIMEAQELYKHDKDEFLKSYLRYRKDFGMSEVAPQDAKTHLDKSKSIFGFNNLSLKVLQQEFDFFCTNNEKCNKDTITRFNKLVNTKILEKIAPQYVLVTE